MAEFAIVLGTSMFIKVVCSAAAAWPIMELKNTTLDLTHWQALDPWRLLSPDGIATQSAVRCVVATDYRLHGSFTGHLQPFRRHNTSWGCAQLSVGGWKTSLMETWEVDATNRPTRTSRDSLNANSNDTNNIFDGSIRNEFSIFYYFSSPTPDSMLVEVARNLYFEPGAVGKYVMTSARDYVFATLVMVVDVASLLVLPYIGCCLVRHVLTSLLMEMCNENPI